ncbi:hypothetical protein, partial [Pseudomonas sp. GL-RE-19]|uniref:hypothetical protein n=1 Tax=Pseudomonas sp. GL-RE-19 TaxID=2832389 RepID=UPI001CC11384
QPRPTQATPPPEPESEALQALKNWSHPFKDKRDPLRQLTHMANAAAGYYPLGRNGLWHGGVHFDSGTAGPLDQSSVHCLADGEVVAYRIDTHSPTTPYIVNKQSVEKPFSRNFVLVRHRLQPPKIEGSPDTPPSLTFYSLYMHLRDWASYEADAALQRPAFWPERNLRVRADVSNTRVGTSTPKGLIVLTKPAEGGHMLDLDLLPPGTPVVVSGEGKYRKLEHSRGPASLRNADGSLQGYVAFRNLDHVSGATYRVSSSGDHMNVRSRFDLNGRDLLILRQGTEITISGEGEFRKLESISQYVLAASLQGEPAALTDQVVVLDQPVPIKAGNLIGHIGQYHECRAEYPEEKLHLEVFSGDDVDIFIEASRAWAQRLPDKDKTWLKLAKGTAVVTHEDNATAARLQMASASSPLSTADLLLPKNVLDALPADRKIQVPASPSHNARTWYRLDGLLHDADNNLLDGWVREEVGVTPWLSPWSWEGYDIIYDYGTPRHALASFFSNIRHFNETQLERYRPMADAEDKGPVKSRLFDIIDRNRDGKMTAEELQAAIRLPAHAQSISQLIIHKESEWYHQPQKWDALDELLGHSGSTPHLNWLAEKQRIKQISWWSEVAEKVGLPSWGKVFHFQPVGLAGSFFAIVDDNDLSWLKVPYGQLTFDVEGNDIADPSHTGHRYFSRKVHWPGGASGITIGRGYDLGQRPNPQADLVHVGITEPFLSWLVGAKGLKGQVAKNYLDGASNEIKTTIISRRQQYVLFLPIYDFMKNEVLRISQKPDVIRLYGEVNWEATDEKIKDITIDLIYRGDYTSDSRRALQSFIAENDIVNFSKAVRTRENWTTVPNDRFYKRSEYLEN